MAGALGGVWAKVLGNPPVDLMPLIQGSMVVSVALAVTFCIIAAWQHFAGEVRLEWDVVKGSTKLRCCRPSNRPLTMLVQPLRLRLRNRSEEPLTIAAFELSMRRPGWMRARTWPLHPFDVPRVQIFDERVAQGDRELWDAGFTVPSRATIGCEIQLLVDLRPEWEQSLRDGRDLLQVTLRTDDGEVTSQAVPVAWDLLWGAAENDGVTLSGSAYSAVPELEAVPSAPQIAPVDDDLRDLRALAQAVTASPTSPLPHPKKYANAVANLDRVQGEARTGDARAVGEFCSTFKSAHTLARDMWGSTGRYYDDFFDRYRPKLEQLVRDVPEDRADSLVRLLDRMTASTESPLPPEEAFRNARATLDDLFRRAEAGDKRALKRLPAVFEDAHGVAMLLYGKAEKFFEFFDPASERLQALERASAKVAEVKASGQTSARPPTVAAGSPDFGPILPNTAELFGMASLGLTEPLRAGQTGLHDLYNAGQRLLRQLRDEGRGIPSLGLSIFDTRPRIATWCRLTQRILDLMPDSGVKPLTGPGLGENPKLVEMMRFLERELAILDAYIKSL